MYIFTGYSQNTGYMGKHFFVNMEGMFSPAFTRPNSYGHSLTDNLDYFAFNYFLNPTIEAIVWKKGTVGVGYNYFTSDYYADLGIVFADGFTYGFSYKYKLKSHGFSVFYKQYLGDNTAPLGHYFKFTFDAMFLQCNFHDQLDQEVIDEGYINDIRFSTIPQKGNLFGMKIEYGYDFLFFNCLKVSSGLSVGTTFGGYSTTDLDDFFVTDLGFNEGSSESEPLAYAKTRILGAYWIGMKIGVGILSL